MASTPHKRFALTGATGLLGRNFLFEIIKENLHELSSLEIIIFGRSTESQSLKNRIEVILFDEGIEYLGVDSNTPSLREFVEQNMSFIDIDLSQSALKISQRDNELLQQKNIHHFFHIAASTDFRDNPKTIEWLQLTNVEGTAKILELASTLTIDNFAYVSSAYVCGHTFGNVNPDYVNMDQTFRNPYERSKLQGELLVKEYEKKQGVPCRIFRPSTIGGRLLENNKGGIPKFDVFYAWAAFFLRWKMKTSCEYLEDLYDKKTTFDVRIAINESAGLNIVPVDFAAKVMYQVAARNIEGTHFHLVNNQETRHNFYLKTLLESFNIDGFKFVDQKPADLNKLESFYYKTVGDIFTPYIGQEAIDFNIDNLKALYDEVNLSCPAINDENFDTLIAFAKEKNFGLPVKLQPHSEQVLAS